MKMNVELIGFLTVYAICLSVCLFFLIFWSCWLVKVDKVFLGLRYSFWAELSWA